MNDLTYDEANDDVRQVLDMFGLEGCHPPKLQAGPLNLPTWVYPCGLAIAAGLVEIIADGNDYWDTAILRLAHRQHASHHYLGHQKPVGGYWAIQTYGWADGIRSTCCRSGGTAPINSYGPTWATAAVQA